MKSPKLTDRSAQGRKNERATLRAKESAAQYKIQVACTYGWYDLMGTEGGPYAVELFDTRTVARRVAAEFAADTGEKCRVVKATVPEDWSPYSQSDCGSLWGTVWKLIRDAGALADAEATEEIRDPIDAMADCAREAAQHFAALPKAHEFGPELLAALCGLKAFGGPGGLRAEANARRAIRLATSPRGSRPQRR